MRSPSATLILDAAILVAATRGRSSGGLIEANEARALITTHRAFDEARRRIELGMRRPDLVPILEALAAMIAVIPGGELHAFIPAAEQGLRDAVASRNGSVRDPHILALAWEADADVWTTDRDFAGAGVATWSTPNLVRALAKTKS